MQIVLTKIKELLKNKLILKIQQRFKIEGRHVFTEENNIIGLSSNDDKRMKSFDSVELYAYRMSKDLTCNKEKSKLNNKTKQYKNV